MKPDMYTKIVLTVIALFLGYLALGRTGPSTAVAQAPVAADAFARVDIIPAGSPDSFIMFDKATGGVWRYQTMREGGYPFVRMGPGGRIEKPGSNVEKLP